MARQWDDPRKYSSNVGAIVSGYNAAMDEGYILKPTDPSAIVRLQDPTVIQQLLERSLAVIAESLAAYFSVGNGFWAAAGTRLAQAALKGRVFQQFEREFRYLSDQGKIPDDFAEKKDRKST